MTNKKLQFCFLRFLFCLYLVFLRLSSWTKCCSRLPQHRSNNHHILYNCTNHDVARCRQLLPRKQQLLLRAQKSIQRSFLYLLCAYTSRIYARCTFNRFKLSDDLRTFVLWYFLLHLSHNFARSSHFLLSRAHLRRWTHKHKHYERDYHKRHNSPRVKRHLTCD